jgi:N-methylhydantoinase A
MREIIRLGIDVGGTFTDAVLWNETKGELFFSKVPSTPGSFVDGVVAAATEVLEQATSGPDTVTHVVHGSTVAANIVHERRGAKVGLITTQGFRDILEIQRQRRDILFDLFYKKPPSLVPRSLRLEVRERLNSRGEVLVPLDEAEVRRAIRTLKKQGCQAIAVMFLFSFLNPNHERRVEEIAKEEFPEAFVSISSVVNPEFRESERTNTLVVDAYVKPGVTAYYADLERSLRQLGVGAPLNIIQSGGGVMSVRDAAQRPVHTIESGPAAGAIIGAHIAQRVGINQAIAFDMGGTTAKACLVQGGELKIVNMLSVERHLVRAPVIDLVEISSGGGTIAWVDGAGLLRLGPRSAGALPGPACYGRGGQQPTICDANALLGYLNPDYLLGGKMRINVELSRRAIREQLCRQLNLDEMQIAFGILRIANANMAGAIRVVTTQRGIDPRTCILIAFGGAGPMHAAFLAQEIGISKVLIPPAPGNVSAFGTLVADMRYDYMRTFVHPLQELNGKMLFDAFEQLRAEALISLNDLSASDLKELTFEHLADLRYIGQGFELTASLPELRRDIDEQWKEQLASTFHQAHRARYKYDSPGSPLEIVALRLTALLKTGKTTHLRPYRQEIELGKRYQHKGERLVYFSNFSESMPAAVYERSLLQARTRINGPAIIEEYSSTTVVPPDCHVEVEDDGNLILSIGGHTT